VGRKEVWGGGSGGKKISVTSNTNGVKGVFKRKMRGGGGGLPSQQREGKGAIQLGKSVEKYLKGKGGWRGR